MKIFPSKVFQESTALDVMVPSFLWPSRSILSTQNNKLGSISCSKGWSAISKIEGSKHSWIWGSIFWCQRGRPSGLKINCCRRFSKAKGYFATHSRLWIACSGYSRREHCEEKAECQFRVERRTGYTFATVILDCGVDIHVRSICNFVIVGHIHD